MHLTALCSTMHVVTFGSDIMCSLKNWNLVRVERIVVSVEEVEWFYVCVVIYVSDACCKL